MNHNKYVILLSLLTALLLALPASAYDFMLDGLCYNKNSDGTSVTVTYQSYSSPSYSSISGALKIPSSVTYSGTTYSVTSIGRGAFCGCSGLTSVTIPNSVTSIGDGAFGWCSGLTSVTIPNSVTSIGDETFRDCSRLTSVTIGNSVTEIGESAFFKCSGLTSVYISDLAKWCAITFGSDDANPLYYVHHLYLNGSEVKDLTIPNSVTSIGNYAFVYCSGLTSVTIPNSVVSIGDYAFRGCSGLTSVTIGNSVASIGNVAFHGCSGLTSVIIPNSVTEIGSNAFSDCSGLTSVTIPNSVTSIGTWAFRGCSGLTSVTIPNSVTSIGSEAFYGCNGLTSVTWNVKSCNDFSTSSEYPQNYAPFNGLTNIKTFEFGNEVEKIPAYLCNHLSRLTSVTIPNSVTSIGNGAFRDCSGLTSVTIPNSVTSIGDRAFYGCSGLTSVTIPNSVTSIGYEAFRGCSGLTDVYISDLAKWCAITFGSGDANPLYYVHHLYLNGSEVKDLIIPNSVTEIGSNAFSDCSGLTSVTIPNSVTSIGDGAFSGCSGLTSATIGNSVTSIGSSAFSGCSGLTSVTIPNSVTSIGNWAFSHCSGLPSVTIPYSVTSIGRGAFCGCSGLTSVTIPNSVTSIGSEAFSGCNGLTSVTWNVKSCNDFSISSVYPQNYTPFNGLTNIKTFEFGNEVEKIPASLCYGLSGLTSVTIPNSVTSIGDRAFYGCSGLTGVTIGNSVTSIGSSAFYGCSGLRSIYSYLNPAKVTLDSRVFYNVDKQQCVLYCLKRFVDAYRNANQWRDFTNISTFIDKYVTSISFAKTATSIYYKGVEQLTVTVLPEDADEKAVNWSSSDPEVASVDQNGNVHANKLGTATVTAAATDGSGVSASCEVTVTGVESIALSETSLPMYVSGMAQLTATVSPDDLIVKDVVWSSSDPEVASVDKNGNIHANKLGTATITATATDGSGVSASCEVTVTGVESIALSETSLPMYVSGTAQLTATVSPDDLIVKDVVWSSSDPEVASVDKNGNVHANKLGTATITATATDGSNVSASCEVTVTGVESIALSETSLPMYVSGTTQLTATMSPDDLIVKNVVWSSSDPEVASVDQNGNVHANKLGTATITATATDGSNVSATCEVTVTGVESIALSETSLPMYVSGTAQLTATVSPDALIVKDVVWSSSDPEVASVDQNGNVHANKLGTATITATATDGSNVSASCEVTVTGVESIALSETSLPMYVSGMAQLTATVSPDDLIVKDVVWSSSDPEVASVDQNGNVHANKLGTATITATATDGSNVSASCCVTVTGMQSITMKNKTQLYVQGSEKLIATIEPNDLIVNELNWTTSDANVVSVDQYGNIRGLSVGTATVTATATDGSGVSASCDVTVAGTSDFVLSDSELLMFVADSYRLGATFTPSDLVWKTLNWTSSDTNVATVSSDGIITAMGSGTATIIATTTDGTSLSRSCQVTVIPKYYLSAGVLEHLRGDDEAVVTLPIMLDNKTDVAQLQFDFTLPEGVSIVGEYNASTGVTYYDDCIHLDNDRKTRSHYATINHLEGSTYRALISTSQSNIALKGNHGTVANLMLHLAQYHEAGDYSILFSNIVMSGTYVNDQHTADNYNSLVRFHYVLGDTNADVDVDVADYQATARVILNLSTPRFYADAANVYNDNTINVSDLQGIVNIMAGIDPAVIKHAPKVPLPATALALVPRVLGDGRIAIALTGDVPIGALQMDLTLPHGVTLEQAVMASRNATHRVDYAALDDGTVRLIVGSPARATLEPDDEAFLVLTLAGASGGTATLGDALAVETDLTTHRLADVAFDITPTGVNDPTADRPRIYVEKKLLVIESPTGGTAQLVRVNGIASPLSVTAGRNEYTLDQGIYIVRMGNTTAKIMIKP